MKLMTATQVLCLSMLSIMTLTGCTKEPTIQYVNIPQKCSVPNVNHPNIDNRKCGDDYKCIAVKATNNYALMRAYAEELEASLDVCR